MMSFKKIIKISKKLFHLEQCKTYNILKHLSEKYLIKIIPPVLVFLSSGVLLLLSLHCLEDFAEEGSKFANSVGYCKVTSMHTDKSYTCATILIFIHWKKKCTKATFSTKTKKILYDLYTNDNNTKKITTPHNNCKLMYNIIRISVLQDSKNNYFYIIIWAIIIISEEYK